MGFVRPETLAVSLIAAFPAPSTEQALGGYVWNKRVSTAICPRCLLSSPRCSSAHFADGDAEPLRGGAICLGSQSKFLEASTTPQTQNFRLEGNLPTVYFKTPPDTESSTAGLGWPVFVWPAS